MGETSKFKLGFSSWMKPGASLKELIELAKAHGCSGVELAVGVEHGHGVELTAAAENLWNARKAVEEAQVEILCIATGLSLSGEDKAERTKAVEELKRCVELADSMGSPVVRALGGELPQGAETAGAVDAVSDAFADVVAHAETRNAVVLIETDGSFANTSLVREVVRQVYSEKLGVAWNLACTTRMLEAPEESYDNVSGSVRLLRVSDLAYKDERTKVGPAELGTGFVPFARAVEILARDLYEGYMSIEVRGKPADQMLTQYAAKLGEYVSAVTKDAAAKAPAAV